MSYNEIEINGQTVQGHRYSGGGIVNLSNGDQTIAGAGYKEYTIPNDGVCAFLCRKAMDGNGVSILINGVQCGTVYFGNVTNQPQFTAICQISAKKNDVVKINNSGSNTLWFRCYLDVYRE